MTFETYLLYVLAVGVFFATPPDTSQLLMISNSVRKGLWRARYTALGDLSANCLQMLAAAFGLAAVIAASATAFTWIKWLGVAYLAWIGIRLILKRPDLGDDAGQTVATSDSAPRLFTQGFVTSMANPFAVGFFAALFPQFIDPALAVWPQLLLLGGTYLLVDAFLLAVWGWLGVRAANRFRANSFSRVNKFCSAAIIAAAALLATRDLQPQPR